MVCSASFYVSRQSIVASLTEPFLSNIGRESSMIKLSKLGVAAVFSLLLSLVVFTTGAFAHSADQKIDRGHIRVSARAVAVNARGVRPYGWGGEGEDGGDGWGGWDGGGFAMRQAFHETVRCTAVNECRSLRECHFGPWGHGCRSIRLCHRINVCHRCRTRAGWAGSGWANSWAAKH